MIPYFMLISKTKRNTEKSVRNSRKIVNFFQKFEEILMGIEYKCRASHKIMRKAQKIQSMYLKKAKKISIAERFVKS